MLDEDGEKIPVVTVRFQGNGTSYVGGVFGVYTASKTTYGTDADLAGLSFEDGELAPGADRRRVRVHGDGAEDATTATFDVDPAVPSGLVFVGDMLIDDTLPRTVALAEGEAPTVLTLGRPRRTTRRPRPTASRSCARIPRRRWTVSAVATARCVAGKAVLTVQATNAPASPWRCRSRPRSGAKQVASLAAGKTTLAAFTTRIGPPRAPEPRR